MPKCLGHFGTDAEMSHRQSGTGAEVSQGHFGTVAEVSWCQSVLVPKCPYPDVHYDCIELVRLRFDYLDCTIYVA